MIEIRRRAGRFAGLCAALILFPMGAAGAAEGSVCAAPAPKFSDGLLGHERWAIATAAAGRAVDFDACYGKSVDLRQDERAWRLPTEPRRLSAAATAKIVRAAAKTGVTFKGVLFDENIDLRGVKIEGSLVIEMSRFERTLRLSEARIGSVLFMGNRFLGFVDLGKIEIGRDLTFGCSGDVRCNLVDGEVSLTAAKIDGALDIIGGSYNGVTVPQARIGAVLNLKSVDVATRSDGAHALDLTSTVVKGAVTLAGVSVSGRTKLDLLEVEGNLLIEEDWPRRRPEDPEIMRSSMFTAEVGLASATISKGGLYVQHARFEDALALTGVTIRDSLMLKEDVSIKSIQLREADIGDSFLIGAAPRVRGKAGPSWDDPCSDPRRDPWTVIGKQLDAVGSKVGGSLEIDRAEIGLVNLNGVATRLSLLVSQCALIKRLKLRTTQVSDLVSIRGSGVEAFELEGLIYGKFDYAHSDWRRILRLDAEFSTQPYRQLAKALEDFGRTADAVDIRYAVRDKERDLASCACFCGPDPRDNLEKQCALLRRDHGRASSCLRFAGLTALKLLIGYGIGLGYFQILLFMGALVVVGMAVIKRALPEKTRTWRFAASLDATIPVVDLNKKYRETLDGVEHRGVLSYIYLHRALAWLFGFFVLAGIAGLTQGG